MDWQSVRTTPQRGHFGLVATVETLDVLSEVLISDLIRYAKCLCRSRQNHLILVRCLECGDRLFFRLFLDLLLACYGVAPGSQADVLVVQCLHEFFPVVGVLQVAVTSLLRLVKHVVVDLGQDSSNLIA